MAISNKHKVIIIILIYYSHFTINKSFSKYVKLCGLHNVDNWYILILIEHYKNYPYFFVGIILSVYNSCVWLGSLMVTCRTCNPEVTQGHRFDSAPGHCRVMNLSKLFTHVPLSPSSIIWYRLHHWDVNRHTARYTDPVSVVS